ncbi:MAG TPA: MaoC family dehydratase [Dehalococcoidia bacterium]|nr:MaoC family dehydratase [Dehalococcoidia bacterium]
MTRLLDQPRVTRYAEAARDDNPIHLDSPEARAGQFGRPVAHGMLVLALVSEAMTTGFGLRWAAGGELRVRWRAPALIPTTVTARAELRGVKDGVASYDVTCEDEQGEMLLSGTASAPLD